MINCARGNVVVFPSPFSSFPPSLFFLLPLFPSSSSSFLLLLSPHTLFLTTRVTADLTPCPRKRPLLVSGWERGVAWKKAAPPPATNFTSYITSSLGPATPLHHTACWVALPPLTHPSSCLNILSNCFHFPSAQLHLFCYLCYPYGMVAHPSQVRLPAELPSYLHSWPTHQTAHQTPPCRHLKRTHS